MKMLLRAAAVYLAFGTTQALAEVEITAQKEFQDWSVFVDGGDCWIATYPASKITHEKDKIYYFVTFHQGEPIPRLSLAPASNFVFRDVLLFVVGGESFEFSLTEGSAHPRSEDEMVIFKRMLRAERLEIILGDMSGKIHAADLSYNGFLDAYQYVSEICAFQHTPVFSDPGGSTKT